MKVVCLALLVRFAAVGAFVLTSSPRCLPPSVMIGRNSNSNSYSNSYSYSEQQHYYHHLGDLDHDDNLLPEEDIDEFNNINSNSFAKINNNNDDVVVFDNVAVALDDGAREIAMKSVVAVFVALAFHGLGGARLFQPRPAFADEPLRFAAQHRGGAAATTLAIRSEEESSHGASCRSSVGSREMHHFLGDNRPTDSLTN